MNTIKACIFDLDGVIVDTAKYHYKSWKKLAHTLGFDFPKEDNERLKGVSRMESLEILLKIGKIKKTPKEKKALADKKNDWYRKYISQMDESEILPGAKEFIKILKRHNIKVALGSSSKNAMTILKQIKMTDEFDTIIDGTQIKKAKPSPDIFLLAAEKLNINPKQCVVFEDAKSGIKAAKNANMFVVGVGSNDALKNADMTIPNLMKISVEKLRNL
ncbi:MAG: beta-phosphoglucomutase [Firmicutes bacterium]|nr:beta-phosphoglucomutase [Bacillota bacterium]